MESIVGKKLDGSTKSVFVESDALTISFKALYHGFKGDKRIPFKSITAVQYKEAGRWLAGHLQLSILGGQEWYGAVHQDENAILFDRPENEAFAALRELISAYKDSSPSGDSASVADELLKLASLKESGLLNDEEFAAAKARLLSP